MSHVPGHMDGYNDHLYPQERGGHVGAGYNLGMGAYQPRFGTYLDSHRRQNEAEASPEGVAFMRSKKYEDSQRDLIVAFANSAQTAADEDELERALLKLQNEAFPGDTPEQIARVVNADLARVRAGTHHHLPGVGGTGTGTGRGVASGDVANYDPAAGVVTDTADDSPLVEPWDPWEVNRRHRLYGGFLQGRGMGRYAEDVARDRFGDVQAQYFLQPGVFNLNQDESSTSFLDYLRGGRSAALSRAGQAGRLRDLASWWGQEDEPDSTLSPGQSAAIREFRGSMGPEGESFSQANIPFLAALQPALSRVAPAARSSLMGAAGRFLTRLRERDRNANFLQALQDRGYF